MQNRDFTIIDFEASSLDENSYPIEVGLAIVRGGVIWSWSSLIRPTSEWIKRDAWSRRSAFVHGITREELTDAPSAADVAAQLAALVADFSVLFCDGGSYDKHWLNELFMAAGARAAFTLQDVGVLIGPDRWEAYSAHLAASVRPHRAEADARRLAAAVLSFTQGGPRDQKYPGLPR